MTDQTRASWNLVAASVAGTAHRGGVCQDQAAARLVAAPDGPVLIAAVADGAGSARHSDQGARVAVATVLDRAAADLATTASAAITEAHVRAWVAAARREVERRAAADEVALRQFACTLLVAVAGPTTLWAAQVGDGLIVFDGIAPERFAFAFWPDSGEYVNTTRFLTDDDYAARLRCDQLSRPIDQLALLTDGLQGLALNRAGTLIHAPFFAPMFAAVAGATDPTGLEADLRRFLDSPRVNDRTDDDKTLVLAVRQPTRADLPRS